MARSRVWQGIRDWLRPVVHAQPPADPREASGGGRLDRTRIHGRAATRARIDAAGGAEVIPFPVGRSGEAVLDERALGFDPCPDPELLEFLAADVDPVPADPAFRERLRAELWDMLVDERRGSFDGDKDA